MTARRSPASSKPADTLLRRARPLLGTLVAIRAAGTSTASTDAAIAQAFEVVSHLHARMSYHDADSDVSRINRAGAGTLEIDPHTWNVLAATRRLSEASDGLFDITVAPALAAHGLLPHHASHAEPAANATWRDVVLRSGHRVELLRPLHIDLGGIAKGYAVDCALDSLRRAGMHAACVNAGGDLRMFGDVPETIHVRHPLAPTQLLPLCALTEGAVATSAPYFSARQSGEQVVSALFDGVRRTPCPGARSVSVVADDCMTADALTKVVYADAAHAPAVLAGFGAYALLLDTDAAGRCRAKQSEGAGWRELSSELEVAAA